MEKNTWQLKKMTLSPTILYVFCSILLLILIAPLTVSAGFNECATGLDLALDKYATYIDDVVPQVQLDRNQGNFTLTIQGTTTGMSGQQYPYNLIADSVTLSGGTRLCTVKIYSTCGEFDCMGYGTLDLWGLAGDAAALAGQDKTLWNKNLQTIADDIDVNGL
jgi:hypothetical protein